MTYETDGAPSEESSETRQSKKPVKDNTTGRCQHDIGKTTPDEEEKNGHQGTTRPIDVGEDVGSVALVGEGREGTGTTVNARNAKGHDGDTNDEVHEVVVSDETSVDGSQDKGRCALGVRVVSVEQTLVARADQETDETETNNVEANALVSSHSVQGLWTTLTG